MKVGNWEQWELIRKKTEFGWERFYDAQLPDQISSTHHPQGKHTGLTHSLSAGVKRHILKFLS